MGGCTSTKKRFEGDIINKVELKIPLENIDRFMKVEASQLTQITTLDLCRLLMT
jgi:hypothetical protein